MPEEIELTSEEDAALDAAWEKVGKKVAAAPPSKPDPEDKSKPMSETARRRRIADGL